MTVISKCLSRLLEPMKEASHHGLRALCPDGRTLVTAYPRLASYVTDDPESKDIFCIRPAPAQHPCEMCWVQFNSLRDIHNAKDERTRTAREQEACHTATLMWQTDPSVKRRDETKAHVSIDGVLDVQ